jgi:PhnB protein
MTTDGVRPGLRALTPYLTVTGARPLIEFAKRAFQAEELAVHEDGGRVFHAELQIGDSVVELADTPEGHAGKPAALHLYLPNADEVYRRAIEAGATSLRPPTDMPYGDREGSVQDPFGKRICKP